MLFALAFAWLSFADLDVINAIAEARNGFEIAFTAVQFVAMLWTVSWAWVALDSYPGIPNYNKVRLYTLEINIFRMGAMQYLTFLTADSVRVHSIYPSTTPVILRSCHRGPAGQIAR